MKRPRTIGVALGSGGARGWAHIGVLNAARELGIPIRVVAGTSIGSLVGAVYVSGKLDTLHDFAIHIDWKKVIYHFLELSFPRSGLVDGGRIVETLNEYLLPVPIERLPLPFAAVATDVCTGEEVRLARGSVVEAVRASIAIPGMFTPVRKDGHVLVDGGLVNPLPVCVARHLGADFVIGVDVTPGPNAPEQTPEPAVETSAPAPAAAYVRSASDNRFLDFLNRHARGRTLAGLPAAARRWFPKNDLPNIFDVLGNSVRIVEQQITLMRLRTEPADVLIRPAVGRMSFMDFHRAGDCIRAGYEAAIEMLTPLAATQKARRFWSRSP
jgi:NTE family protein